MSRWNRWHQSTDIGDDEIGLSNGTRRRVSSSLWPRTGAHTSASILSIIAVVATGFLMATNSAGAEDSNWVQQSVPATAFADANPAHVTCVVTTTVCMVLEPDRSVIDSSSHIGDAVLVTENGLTWASYASLPLVDGLVVSWNSISCFSESDCWAAGAGPDDQPEVTQSIDGGRTWTLETPQLWSESGPSWWPNSIDCVTSSTCWLAGVDADSVQDPVTAVTTDAGRTWSTFATVADESDPWVTEATLPSTGSDDSNGMYGLGGISCISALSCVAVGGLNESYGEAQAISTTDGGASWMLSPDSTLSGIQSLFSVSCVAQSSGIPWCEAVGSALEAAGPVTLTSDDGGVTWSGEEFLDGHGWLSSVSCADISDCWAGGAGSNQSLAGSDDGGTTWQETSGDTSNQEADVSCATGSFCAAVTGDGLFVTTDDGGLVPGYDSSPATRRADTASSASTQALPVLTPRKMGIESTAAFTAVGKDYSANPSDVVTWTITWPNGQTATSQTTVQLNDFYSYELDAPPTGKTILQPSIGGTDLQNITVDAYSELAPVVTSVAPSTGRLAGGQTVTISGQNLSGVTSVLFGHASGTDVRLLDADQLTVSTPRGLGKVPVTVKSAKGGASAISAAAQYTYASAPVLEHIRPNTGPTSGGNTIELEGRGLVWAQKVKFGSQLASNIRVLAGDAISVEVPAASGRVRVVVVAAGGNSPITKSTRYSYQTGP